MATARKHHDSNTIVRWNLMMLWIMATVAGLLTGVIVQSVLMASGAIRIPDEPVMALFPLDYSLGMILGSVQAILMRRHFSLPIRLYWVIANGLAFPLAEQVSSVLLHDKLGLVFGFYRDGAQPFLALIVVGASVGLVISSIQSIVLMFVGVNPVYWITASIVGFTIAIGLGDILAIPEYFVFTIFGAILGFIVGAAIYACITGYVLKLQLASPIDDGDGSR